ncbi:PBS lyase [Desulfovibrio sp. DV]|uniref:PBS lyase n=1 Tax=Desulfovibrio sp. DV TaxID=1844708 RepID=UPI00094B85DB|nr:PBS lyase [Desulfovibrio sp. DV]
MTGGWETVVLALAEGEGQPLPGPTLGARVRALGGGRRLFFPALRAEPSRLSGVLLKSAGRPGQVVVNGREARVLGTTPLGPVLDPEPFCRWENVVSVRADVAGLDLGLVLPDRDAVRSLDLPEGVRWSLYDGRGRDLGAFETPLQPRPTFDSTLSGLASGLAAMVTPRGDVWSFYDLPGAAFRLAGWRWDTGIVLEALAAAAAARQDDGLLRIARTVGDRLLETRLHAPGCPGGFPEWVDLRYSESARQISQWVVPFNTAFVAAGLARLSAVCGEAAYARGAGESLFAAASWGMTGSGGVAGYYFEGARHLRYLGQINDSGIFPRGLAFFPNAPQAAAIAGRWAGYVLDKAACPDGHIGRAWWDPAGAARPGPPLFPEWRRHPGRVVPKVFLRGQAWVLFGLTGALALGAGGRIGEAARRLQDYVRSVQQADGSWLYSQLQPALGACAKTTAALALALAEWSAATGDASPLPAVRCALDYLAACRRPHATPRELSGLPVDASEEGCIIYFRNRPVVCAYAGALELLARLAVGERA